MKKEKKKETEGISGKKKAKRAEATKTAEKKKKKIISVPKWKKASAENKGREKRKTQKPDLATILSMAIFVLIGACAGFFSVNLIDVETGRNGFVPATLLFIVKFIPLIILTVVIQVVIHEGGHLLFGLSTGYHFCSFRIGSLMLVRKNRRFQLKRFRLAGTAGQCLMDPPDWKFGNVPYVLYNLGGVICNLISALVFWKLADAFAQGSPYLHSFMLINCILAVGFALTNGIPLRSNMVDNDGSNALHLGKDIHALRAFWVAMKINAAITSETRLRDMPDEWFETQTPEKRKNPLCASAEVMNFSRLLDELDFEAAAKLGKELLEEENGLPGIYRITITSDLLYLELVGENRREVVEGYRTKEYLRTVKALKSLPSILRTEYAYELLGRKDADAAKAKRLSFEKIARTYPHTCEIEGERELMEYADHCQEEYGDVELTDAEQLEIHLIEQNRIRVDHTEDPLDEITEKEVEEE